MIQSYQQQVCVLILEKLKYEDLNEAEEDGDLLTSRCSFLSFNGEDLE